MTTFNDLIGNPVEKAITARYQLLQEEKKRYLTGLSCSLRRTEVCYNCGSYDHPELDILNWGFDNPMEVSLHTCRQWLENKKYQPARVSPMMKGKSPKAKLRMGRVTEVRYLSEGATYIKTGLPTDSTYQIGCEGATLDYAPNYPMSQVVAFYDKILIQAVRLYIEDKVVADRDQETKLPCKYLDGHCVTDEVTYVWNVTDTESEYCHLAVVKEFDGKELVANTSGTSLDGHAARVIVSTGEDEKIRIRHEGHESQCSLRRGQLPV